ncbi:hypothetical protein MalM25_22220 [Planctomycetes bacterium MalM25]|nr:hypothetical protein MalM25_22220 [Planctomycetes bacterium MalM25]
MPSNRPLTPAQHTLLTQTTRRHFFAHAARGIGAAALGSLLGRDALALPAGIPGFPNYAPKAKRVIYLYMAGGPSQFETFDDKPELRAQHEQPLPESLSKGVKLAFLQDSELKCMGSDFKFKRCGESGQMISDVFPHLQKVADDLCIVRTLQTEQVNHDPAHTFMNTGAAITGRPSMGAWCSYGLGSPADNLPGFVVMRSGPEGQPLPTTAWHNGFLPGQYQGLEFYGQGMPINFVESPPGIDAGNQRRALDTIRGLNEIHQEETEDPEIATRIDQYELAFKMQTSIPELADFASEPASTKELYGVEKPDGSFVSNCLMARRMAQRGVRFVQLYHTGWDHHSEVAKGVRDRGAEVDQGCAALITDLKQRGMLDDTLVIWGGEFGRTPMSQGTGRDHHTKSGSMWLAGGGIRPGVTFGETDPLGFTAQEDPFHVHDFHATVLHLLGVDHKRLTFKFKGRNFRLTDVHGHVVEKILA